MSEDQGVNVAKALTDALKRKVILCEELKVMSVPMVDGTNSLEVVLVPESQEEPAIAVTLITLAKLVLEISKEYIKLHPENNNHIRNNKEFGVV